VTQYFTIHGKLVTIQVNDMCLVDTLRQLMWGPSYNEMARPALEGKTKKAT
jgi:hypothetical protein